MKITFADALSKAKDVAHVTLVPKKETRVVMLARGSWEMQIGVEDPRKITQRKLILISRQIIALAKANKIKRVVLKFSDFILPSVELAKRDVAELLAANFEMANFEFVKYKTTPPEGWDFVEEVIINAPASQEVRQGFLDGQVIGKEVNSARSLVNTPGGEMTPKVLAKEARQAVKGLPVRIKILGKTEMKKLGMGGVLGVAEGSREEPQFIILEYFGGSNKKKPIVLVGKGVTFDTGGLNLKPSDYIYEMHMDMSGGAAVVHTLALAAKLKLKQNVVGLIPAVENMPSGSSYRPGDVLKSLSGKTIEVLNTDAEGRIILADGLSYAKRYNPRLVVDVATLTGAAMSALGQRASAIFTKDEKLEQMFRDLGEESGDYVWPLPLWDEYEEEIKGTFGDVANIGKTKYGGAITGALFLYQFVKDPSTKASSETSTVSSVEPPQPNSSGQAFPWVHIDIAPRMTSVEGEYLAKGAAGAPVRLLIKLLERY